MGKDLGTYFVKVELATGDGWIHEWPTGARYTNGSGAQSPLDAMRIEPTWNSEDDLFQTMLFMYAEGNYACDCNRRLFLARAHQQDEPEESPCGETIQIKRLTAIRPDGSEYVLWSGENGWI